MQPLTRFVALLAVAAPAWGSSFSVFVGPPGGVGFVRVYDESGVVPAIDLPDLADIRLVDLDLSSRAALEVVSDARARLRDDVPGASRLSLPNGRGSLYHFVRAAGTPRETWGFFLVGADRIARVVLELAAVAPGVDPFNARVAVAPDGLGLLVATTRSAGGDLYEVDLGGATALLRTSQIAPLDFLGRGLTLQKDFGAAVHREGILRFDRTTTTDATPVGFAPGETPSWFERQVVTSPNGAWVATIAGDGPHLAYPFAFGAHGDAQRMANLPGDLSGAGLAPEAPNGPWLAITDDGCACAWRARSWGGWTGVELMLGTRATPGGPVLDEHVTRDELFEDYLDEVGVFVFTPAGRLMFVAGDPPTSTSTFHEADFFSLDRGSNGALDLRNLTLTSGDAVPPFDTYGTLEFTELAYVESAEAYLALEREANELRLLAVQGGASGLRVLAEHVTQIDLLESAPQHLLLSVLAQSGPGFRGLLRLPLDLSTDPELLVPLAAGSRIARGQVGSDGTCVLVATDGHDEAVWHANPASGAVALLSQHSVTAGPLADVTVGGNAHVTLVNAQGAAAVMSWTPGGASARIQTLGQGGFVLAGR